MKPSLRLFSRSAWKGALPEVLAGCIVAEPILARGRFPTGPYFVPFANLQDSVQRNIPIYTTARSCTILPNFVGCVLVRMAGGAR